MTRFIATMATLWPFSLFADKKPVELTGTASYYHIKYSGRRMADGTPYHPNAYTIACNDLPLGTDVVIEYAKHPGHTRTAIAKVTDRMAKDGKHRFDFSFALFKRLENPKNGFIKVTVRAIQ